MYFALVSIGRPDVGLALCEHLGVKDGEDWIYADPDNGVYDALMLNRGWDTMIRPATALRFRDRIFGGGGGRGEGSLDQVRARKKRLSTVRTMSPAIGGMVIRRCLRSNVSHDFLRTRFAFRPPTQLFEVLGKWNKGGYREK